MSKDKEDVKDKTTKTTSSKKKTKASSNTSSNTSKSKKVSTTKKEALKEKDIVKEEKKEDFLEFDDEEYFEDDEDTVVEKKKKKNSNEKVKKVEAIAKEKSKSNAKKKGSSKVNDLLSYLDEHRYIIYSFFVGILLTVVVAAIIWPDRIATLSDGTQAVATMDGYTYTADDLYENMKNYYSISLLLDQIDTDLLTDLYPSDDEMEEEVESNAQYYLSLYEQYYGYTESEFLSENGFSSYDDFLDYLRLDYRRSKYLDDYVEANLTDDEIQEYYDENVFGDINVQHILVEFDDDDDDALSSDDAYALAEEIIDKLNDGTSWEDVQEEYADQITFEDLGYQSWDASLEDSFMEALVALDDNSYSTTPVETSYGYHIIYRLDQEDAPSLDDVKDDIIDTLVTEKESEDSDLLYKALISLRKENNLEFSDTVLGSKYNTYVENYN